MSNRETLKSLTDALLLIKANKWATVDELAEWAGVDDATVYSWLQPGGPEPKWKSIRLINRRCNDDRIQLALNSAFNVGTKVTSEICGATKVEPTQCSILRALIAAGSGEAGFAGDVEKVIGDRKVDGEELARVIAEANELKCKIDAIVRAVTDVHEKGSAPPVAGLRIAN